VYDYDDMACAGPWFELIRKSKKALADQSDIDAERFDVDPAGLGGRN